MLMALYTSLNERRREIAILRAIGVGPAGIIFLLVLESGLLTLLGTLLGIGLLYSLVLLLQPVVEQQFGLHIPIGAPTGIEYTYVAGVFFAGVVIGFIPAWKAYRNTLTDGLCVRV
jgi:putative ABC transport system permease protein